MSSASKQQAVSATPLADTPKTFALALSKDPKRAGKAVASEPETNGCFLRKDDQISVKLETTGPNAFSDDAVLDTIFFYARKEKVGAKEFDKVIAKPNLSQDVFFETKKLFTVSFDAKMNHAYIKRVQDNTKNENVWYAVTIDEGKNEFELDPELVNTGTVDSRRGFGQLLAGDKQQTL